MSETPSISVVIPTFNRAKMVCDCVASLLETGWPALEIIVVDDCSPDDTAKRLAARFPNDSRVRYLRNERNAFQAYSRNRGAAVATGAYILFLDDDNVVAPTIFTELIAALGRHPDAGLIAPLAIHRRPGRENVIWTLGSDFNRWTSQPRDYKPNLAVGAFDAESEGRIDFPTTYSPNGFMVPKAVCDELGGMDERYVQIFEESDFGWRVGESGRSAWIASRARTDHYGYLEPGCVPALRQLGIEKAYRTYCFARNRLRFARRHFTFLQRLSVTLLFAPLSVLYYGGVALRHGRPDIAWAYAKGTLAGMIGRGN